MNVAMSGQGVSSVNVCRGDFQSVSSVDFHPKQPFLLFGCLDRKVGIWDCQKSQSNRLFLAHTDAVYRALFHPSGDSFISTSRDQTLKVWKQQEKKPIHTLQHDTEVVGAAFDAEGNFLAFGDGKGIVHYVDFEKLHSPHRFEGHTAKVSGVAFQKGSPLLANYLKGLPQLAVVHFSATTASIPDNMKWLAFKHGKSPEERTAEGVQLTSF